MRDSYKNYSQLNSHCELQCRLYKYYIDVIRYINKIENTNTKR